MQSSAIYVELLQLESMLVPSTDTFFHIVDTTLAAFLHRKPIFQNVEKTKAEAILLASKPIIDAAYMQYSRGMCPDRRQNAQMSLSGLKFMIDECGGKDESQGRLLQLFHLSGVESILGYVENTVGIEPEHQCNGAVDLTHVPSSHYW